MKKEIKKNYYVMDERLKNSEEDKFGHKEISKNIINLINNDKYLPPYNIALIGKWGLGKSSILRLVAEEYKNNKKIKIIEINAWKYEKESLKNECLKKIYEEASGKKVNLIQQLESILKTIFNNIDKKEKKDKESSILKKALGKIWPFLLISLVISFLWQFVAYISNGNALNDIFKIKIGILICKYFNFYFKNILFTLCTPILVATLPEILTKENKTFPLQIKYENDYEMLVKELVNKVEYSKFIIIIDDLDRLSTKKMIEALDTLKILMEINKCVFIVPFDDSIIKGALQQQIISKMDNEQQTIESEFILDKLFQFRFYVPPLILSDMKDYTLNIIEENAKDLYDLFTKEEIEEIVKRIFIYEGLKTPRQIKKIINIFSNNILLFNERIASGKIERNMFNKEGKLMIAKISVLQSDFNDFYDDLFDDPNLCEKLIQVNKGEYKDYKDMSKNIKKYCKKDNDKIIINEQYNKLVNFLSRTSYIKSDDISIYLQCNQDEFSLIYGSRFNRELLGSIQSMNFSLMNQKINENNIENIYGLLTGYLEVEAIYNLPMVIVSILNIETLNFKDESFCKKFIQAISNVLNSDEKLDIQYINLEKLLELKEMYFEDKAICKLINNYYDFVNENTDNLNIDHKEIYELTINKISVISNIDSEKIKKYLSALYLQDKEYLTILNDSSIEINDLEKYFGMELYKYIANLIKDDEYEYDYQLYSDLLGKLYIGLKQNELYKLEINELIIDLLENVENVGLCEKIIVNNIENFTDENKNQIILKINNMNNDNLDAQYNITNIILPDITVENSDFQNKLIAYIENDYDIENIVDNISDYSVIDNLIKNINGRIYENSKFDSMYSKNIDKFTVSQIDNLVEISASKVKTVAYYEGRISSILNIINNRVNIDPIIIAFTSEELIKNYDASSEIINIIKTNTNIENDKIDNYIKKIIELFTNNTNLIIMLEKLTNKISISNLKLLSGNINTVLVNSMNEKELKSIYNIYSKISINDENKEYLRIGLNSLLETTIEESVVSYMIEKDIKIKNSYEYIIKNINHVEKLKQYQNLVNILTIDDQFITNIIDDLNVNEYTAEQLLYLIGLDNKVLNSILELKTNNNIQDLIKLLNVQKIINEIKTEKDLAEFQSNIINCSDNKLLENIIEKFIPIRKSENRKLIRTALENKVKNNDLSSLLLEKIENFLKNNKYRKISKSSKEKVVL